MIKIKSATIVIALVASLSIGIDHTAKASSNCDAKEATLRGVIERASITGIIKGEITRAAREFRDCMSMQSDTLNVLSITTAAGPLYSIFTDTNLYRSISGGRTIGLVAATDYRYTLDGLSPYSTPSGSCEIYRNLTKQANTNGNTSLAASAIAAERICLTNSLNPPRGTVTLSGTQTVGSTISSFIQGTFSDVSTSYQWFSNNTRIFGARSATLKLTEFHEGTNIHLEVTFSRPGLMTNTRKSAQMYIPVTLQTLTLSPTPTIDGLAVVGSTLTAISGTWDAEVNLTYQWLRNGVAISGATGTSYTLTSSDVGKSVSVRVTGAKSGFTTVQKTSAAVTATLQTLTLTPTPTIDGLAVVGSTLTAISGTWDAEVNLTYQWLRNGTSNIGTGSTYTVSVSDANQNITVRVTGSKAGFTSAAKESAPLSIAPLQTLTLSPTPTIDGLAVVGSTLTAISGTWDAEVNLTYQWLRNGVAISGATGTSYTLTSSDVGKSVSVRVTGAKSGFTTVQKTSAAVTATLQTLTLTPTPTIDGLAVVGSTLTAISGTWDAEVNLTYQWLRNGTSNIGTGSTYTVSVSDANQNITVRVTGSKAGFTSAAKESAPLSIAPLQTLTLSPTPTIDGLAVVGSTLTAISGTWDAEVNLTYQWLRNGVAISGATGTSYTLTSSDVGKSVSVRVTGAKSGFTTVQKTSAAVTATLQTLTLTPTPTIDGLAVVGSTLTAISGTWDAEVNLTYQWLRNGTSNIGTGSTYTVSVSDANQNITVRVTGSKAGFTSAAKESAPLSIAPLQTLTLSPTPTIDGLAVVGSTLTAISGTWDAEVNLTYQWLRNGVAISGATGTSYTLTSSDVGKSVSVRVTGAKSGFTTVQKTSAAVTATLQTLTLSPTPTIDGLAVVGSTLTAISGTWDAEVNLTYQWLRNGVAISGATGTSYTLTSSDVGKSVSVRVTGAKSGFTTVARFSVDTNPVTNPIPFPAVGTPQIVGITAVGQVLSAAIGNWSPIPTTVTYEWYTRTSPTGSRWNLAGTGPTYTVKSADLGTGGGGELFLKVIGSKEGYISRTVSSSFQRVLAGLSFDSVGSNPTITGTVAVGQTISASFSDTGWSPIPTTVTYEWYTRTSPTGSRWNLAGTGPTYTVKSADLGTGGGGELFLKVIGSKEGYISRTVSSSFQRVLAGLSFDSVGSNPTITGTVAVGQTISASFSDTGWSPIPTTVTYEWYTRTSPTGSRWNLAGTGPTYTVKSADLGTGGGGELFLKVIGSKEGYISRTVSSSFQRVLAGLSFDSVGSNPTITGTVAVGQTISASFSDTGWSPIPTTVTYEWYTRTSPTGSRWNLAGTGPTYTVKSADLGTGGGGELFLKVIGSKEGYISRTVSSSFVRVRRS